MMCETLDRMHRVLSKTVEVKEGRGRAARTVSKPKYRSVTKEQLDVISNSIDYYKKLMEEQQSKIKLRDYQNRIATESCTHLFQNRFVYLAMEVRTGKTLTSLSIANLMGVERVLFVTKKKAISSIESDYQLLAPNFKMTCINYESLHKVEDVDTYQLLILDEAHSMGAFPKASNRAKQVYQIVRNNNPYVVLLSGTPTPESYSQMYHQVYGIKKNPFASYKNFYRFCDDYVDVKEKKINGLMIKDYSRGKDSILRAMDKHMISYSQKEAGFKVNTREHILEVELEDMTYKIAAQLKKNLVVEGRDEVILADTPVKLMMKLHQIYSGTIKFESGNSKILDLSKANFIKEKFAGKKIGVFYKFKEELNALSQVFGTDNLTTDLSVFKDTSCQVIALQIVSGREGISLKEADALVYYNIDFSATSYWQSRDRMTTKDRLESDVYWVFSKRGIEKDIYKAVTKKKDYTVNHFRKDFLSL